MTYMYETKLCFCHDTLSSQIWARAILSHCIKFDTSNQVMLNLSQLGTTVEMGLGHLLQLLIKTFLLFRKIFTTCLSCLQEISYIFTMVK